MGTVEINDNQESENNAGFLSLTLPEDIKIRPTSSDISKLASRMNLTSALLDRQRSARDRTPTARLSERFSEGGEQGQAVLTAISTTSLDNPVFNIPNREGGHGTPEVEKLFAEASDLTQIPPVFVFWWEPAKQFCIADGKHRMYVARKDMKFEYILAYVPKKDLPHLSENNILYKMVVAKANS